ncbi:sister-chromatid cohesion protein 3 [Mercurialis annua]|uniref:sister-chromatid cohesion protein 3 n=1 Tax=Mercurialis annua TaxID=3986 RepID=UPI00215F38DD|nr:sister-chromatid cohesion protein 3 [Mercurialis annua]
MEDAQDPETSRGRPKRNRGRTQYQERASDASEDGTNEAEREASPDDFEEVRPKAKRNRASEPVKFDQSLIEVIKGNGKNIPHAVKNFVEEFEKDPKPSMVGLLTMLFEACGAKFSIKEELLEETDVDDVVVALVNLARKGEIEDYQSSKKKELKNFKNNLVTFWDNLVVECQNGPLFDKVLFDKCIDYIIALSCTPPRIYRQIASTIGLQLVTSFITVAKTLGAQRETTQRQLNVEMKKRDDGPRVESLNKRLSMTHDKIVALEEMIRKIFTGLFVHRYRDIDSNIRMSCIESLGVWILSYPSLFLKDLYLKYLGWTLNDKNAGVRKASVLSLQSLYDVDDNVPTLGLFTERFSNRMIELADDIDVSVAVCAIGLVKQLLRHQRLSDDDLGPLYDLLIDDPADIRRAIGELVYEHLIAQKFNSSLTGSKDNENGSEIHLSRMLQILREFSADPILSIYVVDDVWEYMKAMKDWKCIISMLLDENPLVELTDDDATNLVRLLFASVRKAVGERIVPASDNRKQYYNKAQKEVFESNRRDITIAMTKNYPLLLRKFIADKAKISSLVEIILHMNLELYSLKRQEQNFKNVLQLMKESFFKHGEKDALRSCVKAILFCSTESRGELKDFAGNQLKNLEDELIAKLKSAMKEAADGDEYSLLVNLKRLYELQLSKAVPIESFFEDIIRALHSFRNVDDGVVSFLLLNIYLHVAWSLQSIVTSETISEAQLSSLLSKRDILLEELEYFLGIPFEGAKVNKFSNHLACRVCIILAEAWCLFRQTNFSSTKLEILGYSPDASVVKKFWKLCEQQLNISDETEDEETKIEYIEETNRDAVMIAAAKLVATGTVSKESLAPEIISHFVMHGSSVAEIVKHLLSILKKNDGDISNIFLEALIKAHQRHLEELSRSDDGSVTGKSFQDCKDLAARLSGTFIGAARNKHRAEILKLVKEGIEYSFVNAPKQLSFLESAMLHFVSKLPRPDILGILTDVQSRTENVNTDEDPSGWRPYFTFVDSLQEKYAKNEGLPDEKEATTARRRGRPRKRQNIEGKRLFDEQSESEQEDSISGSDQEGAHEEEKQDEEDDEDAPLIHSFKSSAKLRSLKVSRDENSSQAKMEASVSRASGGSN